MDQSEQRFAMTEPVEIAYNRYAFRFSTPETDLINFVGTLACVAGITPLENGALVEIDNEFDPDEAWHWVRTELEEEINAIHLDDIWYSAIQWIL
ncbi:MAG: hypothetical protein DWB42_16740 [Chloroflexi bacterium]|nr:hypothetical protein [Chloroflexota bacterium]MDL1883335.1 hypothetical protein [Anaerolineae bacterium CFX8]